MPLMLPILLLALFFVGSSLAIWAVCRGIKKNAKKPADQGTSMTVVITDVQNSTKLWDSFSSQMKEALSLHDALLREELAKHGGYELLTEGDSFQVGHF
jgi:class 3 adenylate cyclase